MSRIKDLTNLVFGELKVLGLFGILNKRAVWLCLCSCGKKTKVNGNNLTCGTTKSCGCLKSKIITERNLNIPLKTICINGHLIVRNKFGQCISCVKEQSRLHDKKRKMDKKRQQYMKEYLKKYYKDNKDHLDLANRLWVIEHPEAKRMLSIKCKTNRKLRIVAWTDWPEIKVVYKNCPKGKVVDHYIPLQGDKVSGLHVSWNLQYLIPVDNLQKWNLANVQEISEWYGRILEAEGLK
jgi:hypothetical protein